MEVSGDGVGPPQLGPSTSTPTESSPPSLPTRTNSSSSESSESGEEWLIKVCCPGARHRYRKHAHAGKANISSIPSQSTSTGIPINRDKEDTFAEKTEWRPLKPFQDYTRVPKQESSDLQWLIRLRCPRAQMEQSKQSFPGVSASLSRSQSKMDESAPLEKTNTSESWLTQKHVSIAQGLVNESQDVTGPIQFLLERENCFVREVDRYLKQSDFLALRRKEMLYKKWFENVSRPLLQKIQEKVDSQSSKEIEERKRKQLSLYLQYCNKKGSAFLESYSPSSYDPLFLKTCSDFWKASLPPLHDPLLKEIQERYTEASIIQHCDTGKLYSSKEMNELLKLPQLPLSRQLMNPIEWLKIPFQYVESDIRQKSRNKMLTSRNMCSVDFKRLSRPGLH